MLYLGANMLYRTAGSVDDEAQAPLLPTRSTSCGQHLGPGTQRIWTLGDRDVLRRGQGVQLPRVDALPVQQLLEQLITVHPLEPGVGRSPLRAPSEQRARRVRLAASGPTCQEDCLEHVRVVSPVSPKGGHAGA